MKRQYVKPIMRVVSCRQFWILAASPAAHSFNSETEGGPTGYNEGDEPNPGNDDYYNGARKFRSIWDD